jgi:hypothetical protein
VHILKGQKDLKSMIHLKLLENQEQANSKTNRREIIKIKAEITDRNKNKLNKINDRNKNEPYKELMKQKVGSLKK